MLRRLAFLERKPDHVVLLIGLYLFVQALVRSLVPGSLGVDESQQVLFGQWLALGYNTQPPLYNWVQYGVFQLFGFSMAALAGVKAVFLFVVYAGYYRLARILVRDPLYAVIATLGLFFTPQMFWQAQRDLTHTVSVLALIPLFLLSVHACLKRPSALGYGLIGLAIGAGMLTKYNFVLVVAATLLALLSLPQARARVLDPRLAITALVAALICLPHGLWILSHPDLASEATLNILADDSTGSRLGDMLSGLVDLFTTTFAVCAPVLALFALVFGRRLRLAFSASSEATRFFARFYLFLFLALLLMLVLLTVTNFRDRWLLPFLFLVPMVVCLKLDAAAVDPRPYLRRFAAAPVAIMILLPLVLTLQLTLGPALGLYDSRSIPYRPFLDRIIAETGRQPVALLSKNWHVSGNLKMAMPDLPVLATDFAAYRPPIAWSEQHPLLVVWTGNEGDAGKMSDELRQWLAENAPNEPIEERHVSLPFLSGGRDSHDFGYALIPAPKP